MRAPCIFCARSRVRKRHLGASIFISNKFHMKPVGKWLLILFIQVIIYFGRTKCLREGRMQVGQKVIGAKSRIHRKK